MKRFSEYIIPFSSYSNGEHTFEFELVDAFFGQYPEGEISQAEVQVNVELIKNDRQLEFSFMLDGWVLLPCDRCLEDYKQEISGEFELFGKFGEGSNDDELDVVWLEHGEHQIDLSQYLYEYVILSLPMRKVHPDLPDGKPGCDPEMLGLIEKLSVK